MNPLEFRPNTVPQDEYHANATRDEWLGITDTLKQRGARYGDFATGSALAVNLKRMLRAHANHARLHAGHQQALDIIMDKVSRIINGDPLYADNWHDIAGYATLGEQLCTKD